MERQRCAANGSRRSAKWLRRKASPSRSCWICRVPVSAWAICRSHASSRPAHKGMNLPGLHGSAPALTDKDREDALDGVRRGVDYLGLSFVRRAEDLGELRALAGKGVKLVAKIEKATALE